MMLISSTSASSLGWMVTGMGPQLSSYSSKQGGSVRSFPFFLNSLKLYLLYSFFFFFASHLSLFFR